MAIKAADMFARKPGSQLDFTSGVLDMTDMFNEILAPLTNQLLETTGAEDPFIEGQEETLAKSEAFQEKMGDDFMSAGESQFGFQSAPPQQTPESSPRSLSQHKEDMKFSNPLRRNSRNQDAPEQGELSTAPVGDKPPLLKSDSDEGSRPPSGDFDPASFTFNSEAQRDSKGRLRVYNPPSGDGGGAFEVAGITARYQPKEAAKLRSLINNGKHAEAESMAKDFYRKRAEPFVSKTENRGLQLQMADSVHHRGEGGLRRILQLSTGSSSKSYTELISQLDSDPAALEKFNRARNDYEWDEIDRGRSSRKKFRKGLQNRFNNANKAALSANKST